MGEIFPETIKLGSTEQFDPRCSMALSKKITPVAMASLTTPGNTVFLLHA
ncbi:MAG TPA: hypothetical protein VLH38_01370 [Patescibacteria group bacterium]|nr:hypothetical protein [Patescibacteria group bacterium]